MKKIFLIPVMALAMASCGSKQADTAYTLEAQVPEQLNGQLAYVVNFDDGEKVDSAVIENGLARFAGSIDAPIIGRIVIDGQRMAMFVLEPGDVRIDADNTATGTPLNETLEGFYASVKEIQKEYAALADSATEADREAVEAKYDALVENTIVENADNPVGYYLFIQQAYNLDLPELEKALEEHPALNGYKRVDNLLEAARRKASTQPGNKYVDFEVTNDEGTFRLSDFVGKGKYTLVDFWASWCGPCIRETAVIKDLYKKYGDKGLDVLGVAVWDEPQNTRAAIERHQLPWPQIIDAQTIPTDLYGISAIPCIILIDPEGNIVSRDKQDAELVADVEAAMAAYAAAN